MEREIEEVRNTGDSESVGRDIMIERSKNIYRNPIAKALITLKHLRGSSGKMTLKQSRNFAYYVVEMQRDDALYRYRNRWFTFLVWPYMAYKRWKIRRWHKNVSLEIKTMEFQEEG